jgi:hypothetical protein
MPGLKLNASNREDLSDARLLLDTASHNAQAALRNPDPDEAQEALDAALNQARQAAIALERVRSTLPA